MHNKSKNFGFVTLIASSIGRVFFGKGVGQKAKLEGGNKPALPGFTRIVCEDSRNMLEEVKGTFRFDAFGDEAFWGDIDSYSLVHNKSMRPTD